MVAILARNGHFTVMFLSFRTDRSAQTVQTQIRQLLEELSLIRVYTVCNSLCIFWMHYSKETPSYSTFRVIIANFRVSQILVFLRYAISKYQPLISTNPTLRERLWFRAFISIFAIFIMNSQNLYFTYIIEPRHDKSCLQEFPTWPDTNSPAQPQKLASLEISAIESRDIILSKQRTTKALIRLHGCAGWTAPLWFAYDIRHIFSWPGSWATPFEMCLRESPTRQATNWPAQLQRPARILKFRIYKLEVSFCLGSEQQRHWSDCADSQADLRFCYAHIA